MPWDLEKIWALESSPRADELWCGTIPGALFHSTGGGQTCREIENAEPSGFGFAVVAHPEDPGTAWFVPSAKDEKRYPVGGAMVVTPTCDGAASFEVLRHGLPQQHAYDVVYRHGLDIDADGCTLAFGSTTGNLWLSEDQGDHWQTLSTSLLPIYCVRFGAA